METDQRIERLLARALTRHPKSILLLGPRQVGKSTLLKELQPDLIVNLAREREFLEHSGNPDLLEERIRQSKPSLVLIDEIQRIPSLLNTIQAILDEARSGTGGIRFLISGSSARKLKRGQANLLPGRILSYSLGGLSALELGKLFDVDRAMAFGFLPEPYLSADDELATELLTTYAGVYLREEIQSEMLVRNIQGFSRFLYQFAEASGRILDLSKVATKAHVSRTGASRFLEILEETLLIYRCDPFSDIDSVQLVRHPKYYFFDTGVLNGLLGSFEASRDRVGNLFEHLVVAQLYNSAAATHSRIDLRYFRTRNGLEVDFLLKKDRRLWAIEAKWGNVDLKDSRPIEGVCEYLPKIHRKIIVVPKGPSRRFKNGVEVLPLSELIREIFPQGPTSPNSGRAPHPTRRRAGARGRP